MGRLLPPRPALPPDRPNPIEPKDFEWDDSAEGCRGIAAATVLGLVAWVFLALAFGVL